MGGSRVQRDAVDGGLPYPFRLEETMARYRHQIWPVLAVALMLVSLVLLSSCETPQNNFQPMSDAAEEIHAVYIIVTLAAAVVGVVVLGVMAYIMIRFRSRPGRAPSTSHGNTKLEIIWTVIPFFVLVLIGIPSVMGIVSAAEDPQDDAVRIRAIGHQWWWEFRYEGMGPDGQDLVTANEIRLPVGQQAYVTVESVDVIHSFWVPKLIGKLDAMPGKSQSLQPFIPKEVGTYYGVCAEYCGLAHALMRFRVVVEPLADFQAWVTHLQTPPATPAESAVLGEALFNGTCGRCHAVYGTVAEGTVGPNLTLFGERTTLGAGILENSDANLHAWISNIRDIKPVNEDDGGIKVMPSFDAVLSDDQISSIVAYLKGLKIDR